MKFRISQKISNLNVCPKGKYWFDANLDSEEKVRNLPLLKNCSAQTVEWGQMSQRNESARPGVKSGLWS